MSEEQGPYSVTTTTPIAQTPMEMVATIVARGGDMAQLEKLLDLQDRWERNEAKKAFVKAMAAFKENPPTIVKDKQASFNGKPQYSFANLAQVSAVIGRALSAHGLSASWKTEQDGSAIKVTCVLTHVEGHSESCSLSAGADTSGSKNAIQAIGSTKSYLEKYTLLAITGLAADDQDDDGNTAGTTDEKKEKFDQWSLKLEDVYQAGVVDGIAAWWKSNKAEIIKDLGDAKAAAINKAANAYTAKLKEIEKQQAEAAK